MSAHRDFDLLVFAYLDGDVTPRQVMALRDALRGDPALRGRLAALVRLHRAQSAALGGRRASAFSDALGSLRRFADRAGRCLAHACVLALVCVELEVAVPGVDARAWLEPESPSFVEQAAADDETGPAMAPDAASEEETASPGDVREPDFLES